MAKFHPSDNVLVEFSAGNLDWALGIVVSAHIQLCPQCKNKVVKCNALGGATLSKSKPVEVSSGSFGKLMSRIKAQTAESPKSEKPAEKHSENAELMQLPSVVRKLVPKDKPLKWNFVSPALREANLTAGQDKYEVCFHKIKRGGRVAEHDHKGLEVTLVLEGSFSDASGNYTPGDFIVREPGDVHRPMAAQDQDCLCLSVVEAPVKVTGLMGKFVNPFLSVHPQ